jgi:hypothetical protein
VSAPRRDDAYDFLAIVILPIHVHNQKDRSNFGRGRNGSNRVPALLSGAVDAVKTDEAVFILKDQCRQLE